MPSGEENQIFGVDHFSQALHGTHSLILVLKHFVFPALLFQLIYLLSLQMKGSENRQAHQLREAQRARTHVHYVCAFERVLEPGGFSEFSYCLEQKCLYVLLRLTAARSVTVNRNIAVLFLVSEEVVELV